MVNILTDSEANSRFDNAKLSLEGVGERKEGEPHEVYQPSGTTMKKECKYLHVAHSKAPGVLGFLTRPGCISFYTQNGKTYAVSEGRWWLMKVCVWCQPVLYLSHLTVYLNIHTEPSQGELVA